MHVAIIMDGNGRWAAQRGLPRTAGHRAGVMALRDIVEAAPGLGVKTISVFAFSADNWRRPLAEVNALMGLLSAYLRLELARLVEAGIKLNVIGRRDRLSASLVGEIERAERASAAGRRLHLRVAVDYSSRDAIARAATRCAGPVDAEGFGRRLAPREEGDADTAMVDLMIRTGGEKRLSDFLLWECAYAELAFTDLMWPDFKPADLAAALADFSRRERRFGGLGSATSSPAAGIAAAAAGADVQFSPTHP